MRMRHQLLDDGRVLVSIIGGAPAHGRVPASEAKRFAWALLSDLDPEGAAEAGAEPPLPEGHRIERDRAAPGEQMRLVWDYLDARGEANTREVASHIGTNVSHAAVQLLRMSRRKLVTRLSEGRCGAPAFWKAGPLTIDQWKRRLVPGAAK